MMDSIDNMQFLLALNRLQHGMAFGFEIDLPDRREGVLINWHGDIHAYQNSCPHTGVSLNWAPNQFLDLDERFIQCGMHGALFEPATGLCIRGPCLGQSLQRLPVRVIDEQIYVVLA